MSLALLSLAVVPAAGAVVDNPNVVPPSGDTFGKSYGAWSAAWWQYALSRPTPSNALLDTTGAGCGVGQSGPVFFLVGTVSGTATRDLCVVPRGKALFFPVANAFDVHTPGDGLDTPQLVWDDLHVTNHLSISGLHATIDGVTVTNLSNVATSPYRACAGPVHGCAPSFSLTLPTDNILTSPAFVIPAGNYAPAVADGYYLLLSPLPPGAHTISFSGGVHLGRGHASTATTYHLTVQ